MFPLSSVLPYIAQEICRPEATMKRIDWWNPILGLGLTSVARIATSAYLVSLFYTVHIFGEFLGSIDPLSIADPDDASRSCAVQNLMAADQYQLTEEFLQNQESSSSHTSLSVDVNTEAERPAIRV